MEMKLKEFRKLSKAEKKEFKKAGGKVRLSIVEKFGAVVLILGCVALFKGCDISDKRTEAQKIQDRAVFDAEANCSIAVKRQTKIPDSFDSDPAIVTGLKDGSGYFVKMKFKAKNQFGVTIPGLVVCSTDLSGKVTAIKIN